MSKDIKDKIKNSKGQEKCEEEKQTAKELGDKIKEMKEEEAKLKETLDK
jgi:hypothetical protein